MIYSLGEDVAGTSSEVLLSLVVDGYAVHPTYWWGSPYHPTDQYQVEMQAEAMKREIERYRSIGRLKRDRNLATVYEPFSKEDFFAHLSSIIDPIEYLKIVKCFDIYRPPSLNEMSKGWTNKYGKWNQVGFVHRGNWENIPVEQFILFEQILQAWALQQRQLGALAAWSIRDESDLKAAWTRLAGIKGDLLNKLNGPTVIQLYHRGKRGPLEPYQAKLLPFEIGEYTAAIERVEARLKIQRTEVAAKIATVSVPGMVYTPSPLEVMPGFNVNLVPSVEDGQVVYRDVSFATNQNVQTYIDKPIYDEHISAEAYLKVPEIELDLARSHRLPSGSIVSAELERKLSGKPPTTSAASNLPLILGGLAAVLVVREMM